MRRARLNIAAAAAVLLLLCGCTPASGSPVPRDLPSETEQSSEAAPISSVSEISSEPAPSEPDTVISVTISAAGDCALCRNQKQTFSNSFDEAYEKNGPSYFLKNVADIFSSDDFTIVNLECSLTNSDDIQTTYYNYKYGQWRDKLWNHRGKPEYVQILTSGGVEGVSMGNNHNMDYGQSGFDETVDVVENAGISWACDEALGYYTVNGIKIGFVSVNEHYDGQERAESFLRSGIATLRASCDLVLACVHWGDDYVYETDGVQMSVGRHCIDWGADMVIGNHPHVIHGAEKYKGKYIFYALGNFCYGCRKIPEDKDCLIVQQTFTFINGQLQLDDNVTLLPCFYCGEQSLNNVQPVLAEGDEKQRIINKVNAASVQFGLSFDENGRPVDG